MYIFYFVDNYFQGSQLIDLTGRLLTWWNRDTNEQECELATLGLDGVE